MSLVAFYAAIASISTAQLRALRPMARLAGRTAEESRTLVGLDNTVVRRAIAARPLDQGLVNVAMFDDALTGGHQRDSAWMNVLSQMGWRDTPSLRNRLYVAANASDLETILDVSDALMRRRQLVDQLLPVLVLTEADERTRALMVARLAARPTWRETYLQGTGVLTTPDQIRSRYAVLRELVEHGSRLSLGEAQANAIAMDRGGRPDLGHRLWVAVQPDVTEPLNDPDFVRAARRTDDTAVVPYEWSMFTGEGYAAEAFVEDGRSQLEIRWNGRGVPVFARQRTAARPGSYMLAVDAPPESAADLEALVFRLVCDRQTVELRPAGTLRFRTETPVPCAFPILEMAGDLQAGASPRQLVIRGLRLSRQSRDGSR